jgi:hypothetical protein
MCLVLVLFIAGYVIVEHFWLEGICLELCEPKCKCEKEIEKVQKEAYEYHQRLLEDCEFKEPAG